ncbi:cytochrome P450 [Pluteus cervinus]|uniref:Cytochrome P450 n=1 Tax=Pluteus cervinus TaxID=181527 RepID=A0ACD3BBT7_9AGAR|nr:cytochrome P450 [Pluteus cervinus]
MILLVLDTVLAFFGLYLLKCILTPRRPPLPPGPPPRPLIGNLLDMPSEKPWYTFREWGKKWGPITSVSVFGDTYVILNSVQDAIEMLDRRSAIYSDRPSIVTANLTGWNSTLVLTSYNDERFRHIRTLFQKAIGTPASMSQYYPVEERETHRFLQRLLKTPDDFVAHIRMTAGAIILRISHGYQVQEENDQFVTLAEEALEQFSIIVGGNFLVNLIPALQYLPEWMPGAAFKRSARFWTRTLADTVNRPYNFLKEQMALGPAEVSVLSRMLQANPNIDSKTESTLKWAAASMYGGGADTTVASVHAFFKAMIMYPDVQRKAQAEIDAVIGEDRLPTYADRDSLPYVNALALEALRWHSVTPTSVPHRVTEDNIYKGYFIPKGSIVTANIWGMAHDPAIYHDPMVFNPARFLASPGHELELDPRSIVFGFGRRICPGKVMADASVFLSCAMTLAVFDISQHTDNERTLALDIEQTTGTISHPTPFKCTIRPRSEAALALIKDMS